MAAVRLARIPGVSAAACVNRRAGSSFLLNSSWSSSFSPLVSSSCCSSALKPTSFACPYSTLRKPLPPLPSSFSSCTRLCNKSAAFLPRSPSSVITHRFFSSEPEPRRPGVAGSGRIKFWPFVVIIALGSAGYVVLVNRRKDMAPAAQNPQLSAPAKSKPALSPDDVTVVFVLGGPGAGKGTQCARLVAEHGFTHLSAGDLLRAEQERPGSEFGDLIRNHIKDGLIVPMEVTVQLLENAMVDVLKKQQQQQQQQQQQGDDKKGGVKGRFLIDGFPRKMDQAHRFEEAVCPARLVLFYECNEKVMLERLLERGKTSGRADDNTESIRKRFRTFVETSMPVVDYYDGQSRVVKIDATQDPDKVFAETQKRLTEKLGSSF